jgi:hypothetical protein
MKWKPSVLVTLAAGVSVLTAAAYWRVNHVIEPKRPKFPIANVDPCAMWQNANSYSDSTFHSSGELWIGVEGWTITNSQCDDAAFLPRMSHALSREVLRNEKIGPTYHFRVEFDGHVVPFSPLENWRIRHGKEHVHARLLQVDRFTKLDPM